MRAPVRMFCIYRVKPGKALAFRRLLEAHWPTLHRAGLATPEPAQVFRCEGKQGGTFFVEVFSWADETASDRAHASPDVMAVWEPMGELCDEMEFAVAERVAMPYGEG